MGTTTTISWLRIISFSFFCLSSTIHLKAQELPEIGIDHMNIVVQNLDSSRVIFEQLGFAIKPGRLHPNSIDNLHLKFADGSELELITASKPKDDLAKEYLRLLELGEGAAFLACWTSAIEEVNSRLLAENPVLGNYGKTKVLTLPEESPLRSFWFMGSKQPTDKAEFTSHPNFAKGIAEVWVNEAAKPQVISFFSKLGKEENNGFIKLDEGKIRFVESPPNPNGRPLVGLVIEVEDIKALEKLLIDNQVLYAKNNERGKSYVFLKPEVGLPVKLGFVSGE